MGESRHNPDQLLKEIQADEENRNKGLILCQEKVQIKNDFFPSCQHT